MGLGEFDMIAKYFLPLTKGRVEAGGLLDDAAILSVPDGYELVVSSDTLNAGTHFLPDQPVRTMAKKALRTNVSDMLAMGAKPYCYQLALAFPKDLKQEFLMEFCAGLAEDQDCFDLFLSGGDTTSTLGPLSISITIFGLVERGRAVKRSGAKAGDALFLTGPVGRAWCGLQTLRGDLPRDEDCVRAYQVPDLPYAALPAIQKYARGGIDISDGLLADLGHICKASCVGAVLRVEGIQFSQSVQNLIDQGRVSLEDVLTGGDDYQLLLAVPSEHVGAFVSESKMLSVNVQQIGEFVFGAAEVRAVRADGSALVFTKSGWAHF